RSEAENRRNVVAARGSLLARHSVGFSYNRPYTPPEDFSDWPKKIIRYNALSRRHGIRRECCLRRALPGIVGMCGLARPSAPPFSVGFLRLIPCPPPTTLVNRHPIVGSTQLD